MTEQELRDLFAAELDGVGEVGLADNVRSGLDNSHGGTAAMAALRILAAERDGLRKALEFYRDEWRMNGDGDTETPGLSRSWMEPTDELWSDEGRKAREALATPAVSDADRG